MSRVTLARLAVALVGLVMVAGLPVLLAGQSDFGVSLFGPVFYVVAAFLVWRVPENRVSWVLLGITLGLGLGSSYRETVIWAEVVSFAGFFALVLPGLGVFLPAWFPTGYPPGNRWRWLSGVGYSSVGLLILSIVLGLAVGDFDDDIVGCPSTSACLEFVGVLLALFGCLAAVVSLFFRFYKSSGTERRQLKLLALAFSVFLVGAGLEFGGMQDHAVAEILFAVGTLAVPVALMVTISRYRLYDIDRIISRTITYAIVVGLGAGAVALLAAAVGTRFDEPLVVAATTLGVAALFNPLRRRVQSLVDRRFNRSRYDAELVMDEFARSLRDETDADEVVAGWVGTVETTMRPSSVRVWVR